MGYSNDLTDKQWSIIEPIFKINKGKNFVKHDKRDLVNAVLYLVKTGCQWRLLPNDFPPYTAVWSCGLIKLQILLKQPTLLMVKRFV